MSLDFISFLLKLDIQMDAGSLLSVCVQNTGAAVVVFENAADSEMVRQRIHLLMLRSFCMPGYLVASGLIIAWFNAFRPSIPRLWLCDCCNMSMSLRICAIVLQPPASLIPRML
jgi:hypothetical protein